MNKLTSEQIKEAIKKAVQDIDLSQLPNARIKAFKALYYNERDWKPIAEINKARAILGKLRIKIRRAKDE